MDGKFREAVYILERAKEAAEKTLEKENLYTLRTATNLAWAYYENGNLMDSLELAEKVLSIRLSHNAVDDEETLLIMGGVAELYCAQGYYQMASEKQSYVVAKSERVLGGEHRDNFSKRSWPGTSFNAEG